MYGVIYHVIHPKDPDRVRYVGKTTGSIKRRSQGHWGDTSRRRSNSRFQNWLVKYRDDRSLIEFRVVITCSSKEELNATEMAEISRLRGIGQADLNITAGGDGGLGLPWSEEARAKLSATLKGEGAWKAKLTWEEVRLIRGSYLAGATRRELAQRYPQIAVSTMQKVLRNHTWVDPDYIPPDREEQTRRRDFVVRTCLSPEKIQELRVRATKEVRMLKEWASEYGIPLTSAKMILANTSYPDPEFDPDLVLRARALRSDKGTRRLR